MKIDKFEDYDFAFSQIKRLYDLVSVSRKVDNVSELVDMEFQFSINGEYIDIQWDEDSLCTIITHHLMGDSVDEPHEISYSELKEMVN